MNHYIATWNEWKFGGTWNTEVSLLSNKKLIRVLSAPNVNLIIPSRWNVTLKLYIKMACLINTRQVVVWFCNIVRQLIKFKIYLFLFVQVQNMSKLLLDICHNTFHLGYGLFPFCLGSCVAVSHPVISSTQSFDLYLLQKGLKSLSGGYWKLRMVNCQPWQKCWLSERDSYKLM